MRSIKQKLLVRILAMTAAAALICGGVGIAANYISSHSMLEQSLESTASLAATRVSYELLSYQNAVRGLGMVPELSDGAVPVTEKERIVDHWAQSYGMERGNLLDLSGRSLFDGNSYSDRAYFQQAAQGEGCTIHIPLRRSGHSRDTSGSPALVIVPLPCAPRLYPCVLFIFDNNTIPQRVKFVNYFYENLIPRFKVCWNGEKTPFQRTKPAVIDRPETGPSGRRPA